MELYLKGTQYMTHHLIIHSILLLGSESHGISEELIPLITNKTTIPGEKTQNHLT